MKNVSRTGRQKGGPVWNQCVVLQRSKGKRYTVEWNKGMHATTFQASPNNRLVQEGHRALSGKCCYMPDKIACQDRLCRQCVYTACIINHVNPQDVVSLGMTFTNQVSLAKLPWTAPWALLIIHCILIAMQTNSIGFLQDPLSGACLHWHRKLLHN